jgi:hypothetical protein
VSIADEVLMPPLSRLNASSSTTATLWRVAAIAGVVVGALDGAGGAVYYYRAHGLNPLQVFRYIASGSLGAAAYQNGLAARLR